MTDATKLTSTPIQLTDGTGYAHMTVEEGQVGYADSADSVAWHHSEKIATFGPPFTIWVRAETSEGAVVKTTKASS